MSINAVVTLSKTNVCSLPKISPLLEKKEALLQEVEHLKRVKQEIEEKQKEILADLQRQQKEWDAKNSTLQAKNVLKQTCNNALKNRVLFLSTGLQEHKCPHPCVDLAHYGRFCNNLRQNYRLQNPEAEAEIFFWFLPGCQRLAIKKSPEANV
ncbi:MAG: hypothetical protein Q8L98_08655 [Chlamydiales bacterium]|nr:hypothetical protein [Chlamydiales bacterium]